MMKLNIENSDYLNIYLRGSHLFGTANDKSDYDYIVVVKDFTDYPLTAEDGNESYAFVTKNAWERIARKTKLNFLRLYLLLKNSRLKKLTFPILNLITNM